MGGVNEISGSDPVIGSRDRIPVSDLGIGSWDGVSCGERSRGDLGLRQRLAEDDDETDREEERRERRDERVEEDRQGEIGCRVDWRDTSGLRDAVRAGCQGRRRRGRARGMDAGRGAAHL